MTDQLDDAPRIVLVAQPQTAAAISEWLSEYPLQVVSGSEAAGLTASLEPRLILLDSSLDSLDAFGLCFQFKSDPHPAFILMLIPDDESVIERAYKAGADDVLLLPVNKTLLQYRVRRFVQDLQAREQALSLRGMLERANAMRLVIDAESGKVLDFNPAAHGFYGYNEAAFGSKTIRDLDAQPNRQHMQRILAEGRDQPGYFIFSHRLASGDARDVEMYTAPIEYHGKRAIMLIMHDITQRLQVESRLRDSEQRYLKILASSNDVVFSLAPDTTIMSLNPAFERVTGFAAEDWIGHSFVPLVYYDDLPYALRYFERVLQEEINPPFETRFYTVTGEIGFGEIIAHPQLENGDVVGVWGAMRDVTERKLAEEAEREHRLMAEALRDTAAALNATLERDEVLERILTHVVSVVSSETANLLIIEDGIVRVERTRGYADPELVEKVMAIRFTLDSTPNLKAMYDSGKPFVIRDVDAFPGWIRTPATQWVRSYMGAPIRVSGQIIGFLNLDSGEVNAFGEADAERLQTFAEQAGTAIRNADLYNAIRQQAERLEQRVTERTTQLEQERAQFWTILESLSEGVIYDEHLHVRYINRAMIEMAGYQFPEWHGFLDPLRSETMGEAELKALTVDLYDTVARGAMWAREMRLRRKDGTEFDASMTCNQVISLDGRRVGAVTLIRDISQEKALQMQKARFVAYASHELRTPITNLKTRLFLLRRQPEAAETHLHVLDTVVERMRRLVEDLLDTSRFERGVISLQRQHVTLQLLLADVVRLQEPEAQRKQIILQTGLPDVPLRAFVDPQRMVQVITNLVTNAINYTPDGGTVRVELDLSADTRRQPVAVIAVIDNGIGISAEHLPHLFQPFFRVDGRVEGTGLGLSITQQIVKLHGGEITVESEPGSGSIFRVYLPLNTELEPALAAESDNAVQPS